MTLFEAPRPRGSVNVAAYGPLESIVATDTEATLKFAHGDLVVSPSQFFALVKYRKGANSR